MYIIGIDEAGRGPLAGPVAVGAVRIVKEAYHHEALFALFGGILKDSKKMTEKRREAAFARMLELQHEGVLVFNVSLASNEAIDEYGIVPSICGAVRESLERLHDRPEEMTILLDGGLKAPARYTHQETIVRGDDKEPAIMLAALAAKVTRDRLMCQLAEQYPAYGFERHKGYGTKVHQEAIVAHGPCPIHRKTFLKKK